MYKTFLRLFLLGSFVTFCYGAHFENTRNTPRISNNKNKPNTNLVNNVPKRIVVGSMPGMTSFSFKSAMNQQPTPRRTQTNKNVQSSSGNLRTFASSQPQQGNGIMAPQKQRYQPPPQQTIPQARNRNVVVPGNMVRPPVNGNIIPSSSGYMVRPPPNGNMIQPPSGNMVRPPPNGNVIQPKPSRNAQQSQQVGNIPMPPPNRSPPIVPMNQGAGFQYHSILSANPNNAQNFVFTATTYQAYPQGNKSSALHAHANHSNANAFDNRVVGISRIANHSSYNSLRMRGKGERKNIQTESIKQQEFTHIGKAETSRDLHMIKTHTKHRLIPEILSSTDIIRKNDDVLKPNNRDNVKSLYEKFVLDQIDELLAKMPIFSFAEHVKKIEPVSPQATIVDIGNFLHTIDRLDMLSMTEPKDHRATLFTKKPYNVTYDAKAYFTQEKNETATLIEKQSNSKAKMMQGFTHYHEKLTPSTHHWNTGILSEHRIPLINNNTQHVDDTKLHIDGAQHLLGNKKQSSFVLSLPGGQSTSDPNRTSVSISSNETTSDSFSSNKTTSDSFSLNETASDSFYSNETAVGDFSFKATNMENDTIFLPANGSYVLDVISSIENESQVNESTIGVLTNYTNIVENLNKDYMVGVNQITIQFNTTTDSNISNDNSTEAQHTVNNKSLPTSNDILHFTDIILDQIFDTVSTDRSSSSLVPSRESRDAVPQHVALVNAHQISNSAIIPNNTQNIEINKTNLIMEQQFVDTTTKTKKFNTKKNFEVPEKRHTVQGFAALDKAHMHASVMSNIRKLSGNRKSVDVIGNWKPNAVTHTAMPQNVLPNDAVLTLFSPGVLNGFGLKDNK